MSRRRGAPSRDAEAIERREWYAKMQGSVFGGHKEEHEDADGDNKSFSTSSAHMQSLPSLDEDQTSVSQQSLGFTFKSFNSLSVEMYDESVEAEKLRNKVQKREKVEYVKSTHFNPSMWLTRLSKGREERSSIFIGFPGFGESHVHFKKWAHSLSGRGSSVYAVCFPGRMHRVREAPFTTFEEISGSVVDALLELRVVQPHMESRIVCFGHGCGALIAFEVTRLLANLDIAVSHLVISASRSPQKQTKINEDRFGIKIFCMANKDLLSWIKRLGGVPAFMLERNDMMKLWIDLVRADFHVHEHYALYLDDDKGEGGGYCLSCPLTTIGCDDDPSCDPEELEHWKEVTSGLHTHCMFPDGGHSYLHTRPEYSHQVLTLLGAICGGDDSPHFQRPELPDDGESW